MRKIQIGRSENNTYCIPDGTVSRAHAELIFHSEESIELIDLDSKYGTYVIRNDETQKVDKVMLHPEDVIVFGKSAPLTIQEIVETILDSTQANFMGQPREEEFELDRPVTDPAKTVKVQRKPKRSQVKSASQDQVTSPKSKPLKPKPNKQVLNPQVQSAPGVEPAVQMNQSQIETHVARIRCRHCKSVVLSTWTQCPYCEGRL
ncbi:MAG: FHA domain-containing protein [Bdellovibrionales bacterium]|nr:FHA domain-containing protein [Bdellovibrionales bacterium]